jgi:hypothetical protein
MDAATATAELAAERAYSRHLEEQAVNLKALLQELQQETPLQTLLNACCKVRSASCPRAQCLCWGCMAMPALMSCFDELL